MDADRLAAVLEPDYLGDLTSRPMDEVRAMRNECQTFEVAASFLRRMAQGRIDIVGSVRRRRAESDEPVDIASLVAGLNDILADRGRPAGNGRLPQLLAPGGDDVATDELDAILPPGAIDALGTASVDELDALLGRLEALGHDISGRRRRLHERIDALQAEMTRRYRTGEASVDSLLR